MNRFQLGVLTAVLTVSALDCAGATAYRQDRIVDPHFNMTAYDVFLPSNWKFDGVFIPGTSCAQVPFPVFRAYSPDGLTELRRYPRLDWTWSNVPAPRGAPLHPDCLNLKQEMSAQEFVKYALGLLQMAYVRDAPVPQALIDAKKKNWTS